MNYDSSTKWGKQYSSTQSFAPHCPNFQDAQLIIALIPHWLLPHRRLLFDPFSTVGIYVHRICKATYWESCCHSFWYDSNSHGTWNGARVKRKESIEILRLPLGDKWSPHLIARGSSLSLGISPLWSALQTIYYMSTLKSCLFSDCSLQIKHSIKKFLLLQWETSLEQVLNKYIVHEVF